MEIRAGALTVIEADSVVTGVVRDAEIKDANSVIQALEDGLFLATEEIGIRDTMDNQQIHKKGVWRPLTVQCSAPTRPE
jgi:hypothetical protein